jgi:hypothetical protein
MTFAEQALEALRAIGVAHPWVEGSPARVSGMTPSETAWWRREVSLLAELSDVYGRTAAKVTYLPLAPNEPVFVVAQGDNPKEALRAALDDVATVLRERADRVLQAEREMRAMTRGAS